MVYAQEEMGEEYMLIFGTIHNTIKMSQMNMKWQQKKAGLGVKKASLTPQEQMLETYRKQAEDARKGNILSAIDSKIKAGLELNSQEIEYLRRNNPEALRGYEEAKKEQEDYKNQLKRCKTKDEVEDLKLQKMGSFLAQAKGISSNSSIPKGAKLALLGNLAAKIANINIAHAEFTKSARYSSLPTEEELQEKEELEAKTDNIKTVEEIQDENLEETVSRMQGEDTWKDYIKEEDIHGMEIPADEISQEFGYEYQNLGELTFEKLEIIVNDYINDIKKSEKEIDIRI